MLDSVQLRITRETIAQKKLDLSPATVDQEVSTDWILNTLFSLCQGMSRLLCASYVGCGMAVVPATFLCCF